MAEIFLFFTAIHRRAAFIIVINILIRILFQINETHSLHWITEGLKLIITIEIIVFITINATVMYLIYTKVFSRY